MPKKITLTHDSTFGLFQPLLKPSGVMLAQHLPPSPPPQYLRALPGQREFLKLAVEVFHLILGAVTGRQRVAVGVWYLRFRRWLDELARLQRFQPPSGSPKTKTVFKEFLKRDENRYVVYYPHLVFSQVLISTIRCFHYLIFTAYCISRYLILL